MKSMNEKGAMIKSDETKKEKKSIFRDWLGEPLTFKEWVLYKKKRHKSHCLYNKMARKHYRAIRKVAKMFQPWDEGYLFDIIKVVLEFWKDYYESGYRVVCEDVYTEMPRAQVAAEALRLYKEMDNASFFHPEAWDKCTKDFFNFLAEHIHYMWD